MPTAIHHTRPFSAALNGMRTAIKKADKSAGKLSRGEISPENIVDLKLAGQNVRVQTIVLKSAMEMDKHLIDLLA